MSVSNLLPNFLIVGAAKSGTTSLYHYLNQHPDIFIPERKECRFFSGLRGDFRGLGNEFANDVIETIEEYKDLFKEGKEKKLRGDISNDYLYYYQSSIKNIIKYLPRETKVIIVLRNPVDRAYSNYLHHKRSLWEMLSFEEALKAEKVRMKENWSWSWFYKDVGQYFRSVEAYLENFPNVRVFFYEDMVQDLRVFISEMLLFLGVDDINIDLSTRHNARGMPKSKIVHRLIKKESNLSLILQPIIKIFSNRKLRETIKLFLMNRNMERKIESMDETVRRRLAKEFEADIVKLQFLLNRDLSSWLQN